MRRGRIIVIMVLLLVLAGAAGAGFFFLEPIKRLVGLGGAAPAEEAPPVPPPPKPEDIVYCDLPDIMVMLDAHGARERRVLKLGVSLAIYDKAEQPKVQAYIPRILDVFQVYVGQLKIEDVAGVPQVERLRAELLKRINLALQPSHVDDVLFREVQVQ
jgi:flagellar protein FliL